jgi:hypothetical protein
VIPKHTYVINEQPEAGNVNASTWTALLELRNLSPAALPAVCIEEFRNLQIVATRKKQLNAALPMERVADFTRQNGVAGEGSPFDVSLLPTNPPQLKITVPFSKMWLLPDTYTLNLGCQQPDSPTYKRVYLPNLKQQLLPQNLKIIPEGENAWLLQGTNMAAINEIYLEGTKSKSLVVRSDTMSTEFSVPKGTSPGKYKVYLGIRKYFVPAKQWNPANMDMEQVSVTVTSPQTIEKTAK